MSAIIGTAYAVGENTVTSKSYVDAMDATKQDAIPEGTVGSVVIYDGADSNGQTQFAEVGIFDGTNTYTNNDADSLITAGTIHDFAAAVESISIPDNKLTCYNTPDCTLWEISNGTVSLANTGTFAPLTATSGNKPFNTTCSDDNECASGICRKGKCGCVNDAECGANGVCQSGGCAIRQ